MGVQRNGPPVGPRRLQECFGEEEIIGLCQETTHTLCARPGLESSVGEERQRMPAGQPSVAGQQHPRAMVPCAGARVPLPLPCGVQFSVTIF